MCGIAGICNDGKNSIQDIAAMNDAMLLRGPDDGGYYQDDRAEVTLGHRRLAIVDLTETGKQPMISHSGRMVLVFNGEIYNFAEIRKSLLETEQISAMRGGSDTEVLLEALELWGVKKTLTALKGMFAFAVYDRQDKTLTLARDRMGEKPLYYGMSGKRFVFASDLHSITRIKDFEKKIDHRVLTPYFTYGYIPAPYTIYEKIYKLLPGHFLTVKAPFCEWKETCYWNIRQVAQQGQNHPFKGSEEEASYELESLLKEAIQGQMIADVPLGAFLSGGIDSTLVVSLMQSLSERKVKTFTVGFHEKGFNEAQYAKETATHLGTEHTELYAGFDDVMEILPGLSRCFGEPFADSSQIPTMLVSKMTRQHVTVALSGDGGDEFFCGYNSYREADRGLKIMQQKLPFLKGETRSRVGRLCSGIGQEGALSLLKKPAALFSKTGRCLQIRTPEDLYRAIQCDDSRLAEISNSKESIKTQMDLYPDGFLKGTESNLMLMDMLQYLPDDILNKVDRSGMFYSLESRIPLLDKDVIAFSWQLPQQYKFSDGVTKRVLRDILYRYVPKEMMERPKKGFSIPVEEWLKKGRMHDWAMDLMQTAGPLASEYLNSKASTSFWNDFMEKNQYNSVIWNILMFEQWLLEEKKA